MRKKHIPDHAKGAKPASVAYAGPAAMITALLVCLAATIPGCEREGRQSQVAESRSVPRAVVNTAPHFIAGGAPEDIAIACGSIIRRLDIAGPKVVSDSLPPKDYLAIYIDPAGKASRFIVSTDDGPVLLEPGREKALSLPGWPGDAGAGAVAFSPDGRMLAAAPVPQEDQKPFPALFIWKLPLEAYMAIPAGEISAVSLMAWSDDGKSLLVTDRDDRISIYRPPRRKAVFTQKLDPGAEGTITAVDLSPNGDWFLVAANAIRIRAWQLPFMNAQLKAWGRVEKVFFAGDVGEVVTIDAANVAMHWLVNYGNVKADTSASLGEHVAVGVPAGGSQFYVLGPEGKVRAYRSGDLRLLGEAEGVTCTPGKRDSTVE